METNLRQAEAKAYTVGKVSEIALEEKTKDGKTVVSGYITVKTSDVNFVRYNVYIPAKKKDGNPSALYTGIKTIMAEYKSIADAGEDDATIVKVSGDINPYTDRDGKAVVGYRSNFFNRLKPSDDGEFTSEFSIELFIKAIVDEVNKDGEETGRLLVKGLLPTFNGIEPVTLVAEGEIADGISSTFEVGQTAEFYGEIVNNRVEKVTLIPVAIGKPKEKKEVSYKNDLVITGATMPYEEGVSANPPYDAEVIKAAMQERENRLASAKESKNTTTATKPSGSVHNGRQLGF